MYIHIRGLFFFITYLMSLNNKLCFHENLELFYFYSNCYFGLDTT